MATISIIIPVYNSENYIRKTIDSVLSQTYEDWELILINDGSTDNSKYILESYTKDINNKFNKKIRVVHTENGGPSKARNTGIDLATGEYLSFIDSDDTVEKTYLERLYYTARKFQADVVWCSFNEIINGKVTIRNHELKENILVEEKDLLSFFFNAQLGIGSLCNKLYRRSFIDKYSIRINPERYHGEDWEFNLNVFKNNPRVVPIKAPLYNYIRQNTDSVVATYHHTDFLDLVRTINLLQELAEEKKIEYDFHGMMCRTVYNIINILIKLSNSTYPQKVTEFKTIISDPFTQNLFSNSKFISALTKKQKFYFLLIRMNMIIPTICLMNIFH